MSKMICALMTACCMLAPPAIAQHGDSHGHAEHAHADTPVNQMCPIGKEPIVLSAGTVEYKGKTIGLCCPGCGKQFLSWGEARKDEFLVLAAEHREPGQEHHAEHERKPAAAGGGAEAGLSHPYTLDTCPVSGEPLGSMGPPLVRVYGGREVRLCCDGCVSDFESDMAAHWGQIDARIVDQQLMHYPLETCIVTGKPLGEHAVNHVHNNRLVRLAGPEATEAFRADPAKHLAALDEAIIAAQLPGYPLDRCLVGGPLGSMGEPVNFVYMNRLVRFCCDNCRPRLVAEPAKYIAKLDAAYAAAQRENYPLENCVVSGEPLGSMGEPVELVAGDLLVRFCCDGCFPSFREHAPEYLAELPDE